MEAGVVAPAVEAEPESACHFGSVAGPVQQDVAQAGAAVVGSDDELVEVEGRCPHLVFGPESGVACIEGQAADDFVVVGLDYEGATGADPAFDNARAVGALCPLLDTC